jgi:hypothetical protein
VVVEVVVADVFKARDWRAVGEITEYMEPRRRVRGYIARAVAGGVFRCVLLVLAFCVGEVLRVEVAMARNEKKERKEKEKEEREIVKERIRGFVYTFDSGVIVNSSIHALCKEIKERASKRMTSLGLLRAESRDI